MCDVFRFLLPRNGHHIFIYINSILRCKMLCIHTTCFSLSQWCVVSNNCIIVFAHWILLSVFFSCLWLVKNFSYTNIAQITDSSKHKYHKILCPLINGIVDLSLIFTFIVPSALNHLYIDWNLKKVDFVTCAIINIYEVSNKNHLFNNTMCNLKTMKVDLYDK